MQIERIGYIGYKLYRLGWRNGVYRHLPLLQHRLLNSFLYYRRGFAGGCEWDKQYAFEENHK